MPETKPTNEPAPSNNPNAAPDPEAEEEPQEQTEEPASEWPSGTHEDGEGKQVLTEH